MTDVLSIDLVDLPGIGQPLYGGVFAGLITKPDGMHCAVVLLAAKAEKRLTWKQAMGWAKKLKAELPARPTSALLYSNLKAEFEPGWHWTCEELDRLCAWNQIFHHGYQSYGFKSFEGHARAVRYIPIA